jgi:hypothetical protein
MTPYYLHQLPMVDVNKYTIICPEFQVKINVTYATDEQQEDSIMILPHPFQSHSNLNKPIVSPFKQARGSMLHFDLPCPCGSEHLSLRHMD